MFRFTTTSAKYKYDLWVTGTVSPRTRRELTALGIDATENVDEKIGILD
jgi:hypothetical protein